MALDCAFELSKLLDCGLDKETLSICVALIENGVNPEALAEVVKRLRAEAVPAAQAGAAPATSGNRGSGSGSGSTAAELGSSSGNRR